MVHALQQTHSILHPRGLLVNLVDLPVPSLLEVRSPGSLVRLGWLLDINDCFEERASLNALAQVVNQGLFDLEDERDFERNIHIDSLAEFRTWLAEKWSTAILPEPLLQRLEMLLCQPGETGKIVVAVRTRITKLRAVYDE